LMGRGASHLNHTCMYVYTCLCICIYIYKLVHNNGSIKSLLESREMKFDVCGHGCVCDVCMYVYIHIYIYICMYVCIHMYIYVYIDMHFV
jgi:hypothetical protein